MNGWQKFKSFFSIFPDSFKAYPVGGGGAPSDQNSAEPNEILFEENQTQEQLIWERTRFDNFIRVCISTLSVVVCVGLWLGGAIERILPMTGIFVAYGICQLAMGWWIMKRKPNRFSPILLAAIDLLAMSGSVYFTGGMASPLYFVYFIPLIVHAFHRDNTIIIFSGFGGTLTYALTILVYSQSGWGPHLLDLAARVFFMFITVSIAAFAVHLLQKREAAGEANLRRMRLLARMAQRLNRINALNDLPEFLKDFVKELNNEFGPSVDGWARAFLTLEHHATMRAINDPQNPRQDLKQEIVPSSCPAFHGNAPFVLEDVAKAEPCPTESFNFGSHLCVPISGTGNESFGVVFIGSKRPRAFGGDEKEFVKLLARSVGLAVQRLQRVEDFKQSLELNSCATAVFMASYRSMEITMDAILEGAFTILKIDQASVLLWDPSKGALRPRHVRGPKARAEWDLSFQMGEGIPGRVWEKGEFLSVGDVSGEKNYQAADIPVKAMLSIPLKNIAGTTLAVLNVMRFDGSGAFAQEEMESAQTFAARAGLALENALLHQKEREEIEKGKKSNLKEAA